MPNATLAALEREYSATVREYFKVANGPVTNQYDWKRELARLSRRQSELHAMITAEKL